MSKIAFLLTELLIIIILGLILGFVSSLHLASLVLVGFIIVPVIFLWPAFTANARLRSNTLAQNSEYGTPIDDSTFYTTTAIMIDIVMGIIALVSLYGGYLIRTVLLPDIELTIPTTVRSEQ